MYFMLLTLQYDFCSANGPNSRQLPICTSCINPHYANRFRSKPQAAQFSSQRSVNRSLTMIYCVGKSEIMEAEFLFIEHSLVLCRFSWDNYKCLFWLLTSLITLFSMFWFCHWGNHYSCTQVVLNWQQGEKMEFKTTNCTRPHRDQEVAVLIKLFTRQFTNAKALSFVGSWYSVLLAGLFPF